MVMPECVYLEGVFGMSWVVSAAAASHTSRCRGGAASGCGVRVQGSARAVCARPRQRGAQHMPGVCQVLPGSCEVFARWLPLTNDAHNRVGEVGQREAAPGEGAAGGRVI